MPNQTRTFYNSLSTNQKKQHNHRLDDLLNTSLEDDNTVDYGGVAYSDETLDNFISEVFDSYAIATLNTATIKKDLKWFYNTYNYPNKTNTLKVALDHPDAFEHLANIWTPWKVLNTYPERVSQALVDCGILVPKELTEYINQRKMHQNKQKVKKRPQL